MDLQPCSIVGAFKLTPKVFCDERGSFLESWNKRVLSGSGFDMEFVQDNQSCSAPWVLRGLHYQVRYPQGKLVWVSKGGVFDVMVDLRTQSPTFGRWEGFQLDAITHDRLYVPPGCAHGFLALSGGADFHYKCTDYYSPENERTIRWDDSDLNISWPLPAGVRPLLNAKDAAGLGFKDAEKFLPPST